MSRLGKRRANCASEEEGGTIAGTDEAGSNMIKQQRRVAEQPLQQQQYRFGEIPSVAPPSYLQAANNGLYPLNGTTMFGAEYGGLDVQGYMVQQPTFSPSSAYLNSLHYYHLPTLVAEGQNQQQMVHSTDQQLSIVSDPDQEFAPINNKNAKFGTDGEKGGKNHGAIITNSQQQLQIELPSAPSFGPPPHCQLFPNRSPFEPFCTVPGRTSLLSSTTKYKVTIGEIQRRISPPECLNASLIGGILRKAKSKDGGKALRESLKRIGLTLPAGRRKSACVTAFTALVEEEAIHMANDFHAILHRDFPAKDVGVFLNSQFLHNSSPINPELLARRKAILNCARIFVKEFSDLVSTDRSPICDRRPELMLDPNIQKPLTHFSMITHGFGGIALLSMLEMLGTCLGESLKSLDKMFGAGRPTGQQFEHSESSGTVRTNGF